MHGVGLCLFRSRSATVCAAVLLCQRQTMALCEHGCMSEVATWSTRVACGWGHQPCCLLHCKYKFKLRVCTQVFVVCNTLSLVLCVWWEIICIDTEWGHKFLSFPNSTLWLISEMNLSNQCLALVLTIKLKQTRENIKETQQYRHNLTGLGLKTEFNLAHCWKKIVACCLLIFQLH